MDPILTAVTGLTTVTENNAIDQLFDVAKAFRPLPVPEEMKPAPEFHMEAEHSHLIPLDCCDVDPAYQRPLDREKVAAMVKAKAWENPIHVNFDQGTHWIIDGQHRAEAARQAGLKEIHAYVDFMPSQDEADHETGVMAKTLRTSEGVYEGHVLPSQEPALIDVLTGLGADRQVSKVESYGWGGRCYVVRVGTGTITYVPHDAVEKDAGPILTLPERGLLRFDGMAEAEVQYVLKTIDLDVAAILAGEDPAPTAPHLVEVLGVPAHESLGMDGSIEVLAEGIGGRTWPSDWVYMGESAVTVHNGERTLATYPYVSRHPTVEGNWRLIGPKHDLTVRPA